jgi:hypothetical protein
MGWPDWERSGNLTIYEKNYQSQSLSQNQCHRTSEASADRSDAGTGSPRRGDRHERRGVSSSAHGDDGGAPNLPLGLGSDGSLYGMSDSGGQLNLGALFALRPQPTMLPPVLSVGSVQVRFTSMPGLTHPLQPASALGGNWLTLTNLTVPTDGVAEFTDSDGALESQRF